MAPTSEGPVSTVGWWGHPTASIDWCEENYVVSYYIAEFWNTISNLAMIVYTTHCSQYQLAMDYGQSGRRAWKQGFM